MYAIALRLANYGTRTITRMRIGVASSPEIGSTPITWPQEIESQTQLIHDKLGLSGA